MPSEGSITKASLAFSVGSANWGGFDILVAVSMLSCYLVLPSEGHLQQVFHLFAYLKHCKRSRMVFDYTETLFDPNAFKDCDWSGTGTRCCDVLFC
jgi:hypothetical protein